MKGGFTLIELLVVIGIVAILATVVVMTLNPAEFLKQGRDSKRLAEVGFLNSALNLSALEIQGGAGGSQNTVYLSLPSLDADNDCLDDYPGLPPLPIPWTYSCAPSSTYRNTDGSGWIPVNFNRLSTGPIIPTLPVDPVNKLNPDKCFFYRYTPSWELGASLESAKYGLGGSQDSVSDDGGDASLAYEKGSDLKKIPLEAGCQAKWVPADTCWGIIGYSENNEAAWESSGDGYEWYTFWTPSPGSNQNAKVLELKYWQGDQNLNPNESIEMAIYQGVAGGAKLSESVFVHGTGNDSCSGVVCPRLGWVSAKLSNPITINLGATYIIGMGPGSSTFRYSMFEDWGPPYCSKNMPPQGGYFTNAGGGLNATVPPSASALKFGIIGVVYDLVP